MSTRSKRKRRWVRRVLLVLALGLVGGLVALFWPTGPIQVGCDTTRLTGPLNPDGTVNYVAALDAAWSEGVTPENNAAVLLVRACGPDLLAEHSRDEVLCRLGITDLPAEGDWFVPLSKMPDEPGEAASDATPLAEPPAPGPDAASRPVPRPGDDSPDIPLDTPPDAPPSGLPESVLPPPASSPPDLRKQLGQALGRPWTEAEFPVLARWIEINEAPARLVVEATGRPRLYVPMVSPSDPPQLIDVLLPGLRTYMELARFLSARAMLRAARGEADAAWQDVLATCRLARLVGEKPFLTGQMVAVIIDGMAMKRAQALAAGGGLTARQARAMRADVQELAPVSDVVKAIDTAERYFMLNGITLVYRGTPLDQVSGGGSSTTHYVRRMPIDLNKALRLANGYYDRVVQQGRGSFLERRQAGPEARDPQDELLLEGSRVQLALRGPTTLLTAYLLRMIGPSLDLAHNAEDQAEMDQRLTVVALALAEWRAENGGYPDALDALVPGCLAELPTDLFSGGRPLYRRDGDGYLLYSVGPNMTDDGGRTGRDGLEIFDDLVVQVPLPPATQDRAP